MTRSLIRRSAVALVRHAANILPAGRADWAHAMRSEADHIDGDTAALAWALGCVSASYLERTAGMSKAAFVAARLALSVVIALFALSELPVALMALGYMTGNLDLAASMDGATAGDDYRRFIPLLEAMTPLGLAAWFVRFGLYLVAAVTLAFGWRRAALPFATALILHFGGWVVRQFDPTVREIFGASGLVVDIVYFAVLFVIGATAMWMAHASAQRPRRGV